MAASRARVHLRVVGADADVRVVALDPLLLASDQRVVRAAAAALAAVGAAAPRLRLEIACANAQVRSRPVDPHDRQAKRANARSHLEVMKPWFLSVSKYFVP